jgi:hypothetical protein
MGRRRVGPGQAWRLNCWMFAGCTLAVAWHLEAESPDKATWELKSQDKAEK